MVIFTPAITENQAPYQHKICPSSPSRLHLKIVSKPVESGDFGIGGNDAGWMFEDAFGATFSFDTFERFTRIAVGVLAAILRDALNRRSVEDSCNEFGVEGLGFLL